MLISNNPSRAISIRLPANANANSYQSNTENICQHQCQFLSTTIPRMLPANTTSSSSSAILTLLPQPPSSVRRNDFIKICFSQKYQFDCNFKNSSVQSMIQSVHCASIHPKYHDCYDCFAFETVHSTFI